MSSIEPSRVIDASFTIVTTGVLVDSALMLVVLLCAITGTSRVSKLHCLVVGRGRKRKTSEGYTESEVAEMM